MLKCLELLKQAMGSNQSIPYLGLEKDGTVAWASPAMQAAFPQIVLGKGIAQLLPGCFPGGFPKKWQEEEREFPLPDSSCLILTRFADRDGACFLGRYYPPSGRASGSELPSINLLTGQIREQVSEACLQLLKLEEGIASIQENYENIDFFPLQDIQLLQQQVNSAKRASHTMLSFAMQMEEYCRPPEKDLLILSRLNSYSFFNELLHNVTLYFMECGLQFDAKVHPNAKPWNIQLDHRRFTAALLALFRLSYCFASSGKTPALTISVEIDSGALLLRIHDNAVDYRLLAEGRGSDAVPTPASVASTNLRQLVELQDGQWLLSGLPGEAGYYLQIRLPAQRDDEEDDRRLACPSDYLSSLFLSSMQQELINIILADIGEDA